MSSTKGKKNPKKKAQKKAKKAAVPKHKPCKTINMPESPKKHQSKTKFEAAKMSGKSKLPEQEDDGMGSNKDLKSAAKMASNPADTGAALKKLMLAYQDKISPIERNQIRDQIIALNTTNSEETEDAQPSAPQKKDIKSRGLKGKELVSDRKNKPKNKETQKKQQTNKGKLKDKAAKKLEVLSACSNVIIEGPEQYFFGGNIEEDSNHQDLTSAIEKSNKTTQKQETTDKASGTVTKKTISPTRENDARQANSLTQKVAGDQVFDVPHDAPKVERVGAVNKASPKLAQDPIKVSPSLMETTSKYTSKQASSPSANNNAPTESTGYDKASLILGEIERIQVSPVIVSCMLPSNSRVGMQKLSKPPSRVPSKKDVQTNVASQNVESPLPEKTEQETGQEKGQLTMSRKNSVKVEPEVGALESPVVNKEENLPADEVSQNPGSKRNSVNKPESPQPHGSRTNSAAVACKNEGSQTDLTKVHGDQQNIPNVENPQNSLQQTGAEQPVESGEVPQQSSRKASLLTEVKQTQSRKNSTEANIAVQQPENIEEKATTDNDVGQQQSPLIQSKKNSLNATEKPASRKNSGEGVQQTVSKKNSRINEPVHQEQTDQLRSRKVSMIGMGAQSRKNSVVKGPQSKKNSNIGIKSSKLSAAPSQSKRKVISQHPSKVCITIPTSDQAQQQSQANINAKRSISRKSMLREGQNNRSSQTGIPTKSRKASALSKASKRASAINPAAQVSASKHSASKTKSGSNSPLLVIPEEGDSIKPQGGGQGPSPSEQAEKTAESSGSKVLCNKGQSVPASQKASKICTSVAKPNNETDVDIGSSSTSIRIHFRCSPSGQHEGMIVSKTNKAKKATLQNTQKDDKAHIQSSSDISVSVSIKDYKGVENLSKAPTQVPHQNMSDTEITFNSHLDKFDFSLKSNSKIGRAPIQNQEPNNSASDTIASTSIDIHFRTTNLATNKDTTYESAAAPTTQPEETTFKSITNSGEPEPPTSFATCNQPPTEEVSGSSGNDVAIAEDPSKNQSQPTTGQSELDPDNLFENKKAFCQKRYLSCHRKSFCHASEVMQKEALLGKLHDAKTLPEEHENRTPFVFENLLREYRQTCCKPSKPKTACNSGQNSPEQKPIQEASNPDATLAAEIPTDTAGEKPNP